MNETMNETPHTPSFVACLIDVSAHCNPAFLERCGGKVFVSGFYDDNVNTHICSFTPMVFVDCLELVAEVLPEDETARDELFNELCEAHTLEDSDYWTRANIDRWRVEHPERFTALALTFDEDEDKTEQVREHLSGNPVF